MVVRLGEHSISRKDDVNTDVDIQVAQKVRHEGYINRQAVHDIMILVLEQDAPTRGKILVH